MRSDHGQEVSRWLVRRLLLCSLLGVDPSSSRGSLAPLSRRRSISSGSSDRSSGGSSSSREWL